MAPSIFSTSTSRDLTASAGIPETYARAVPATDRTVLAARPGSHLGRQLANARLNLALGATPPTAPQAANTVVDHLQNEARQVEAILDHMWPHMEEQVLRDGTLDSLEHEQANLPTETRPLDNFTTDDRTVSPLPKKTLSFGPEADACTADEGESLQRIPVARSIASPQVPRPSSKDKVRDPAHQKDGPPFTTAGPCRVTLPSTVRETPCDAPEAAPVQPLKAPSGQSGDALLSVHYREGEAPMAEILRLEGGQGAPVIVEAVAQGSKAQRAGVQPGYALVTMNGRSEFMQLPGWQVRLLLEAPITLGFDPAPPAQRTPPACTEIRLKRVQDPIGVAPKVAVCGPKERGILAEEVVFKPGQAPLFLETGSCFPQSGAVASVPIPEGGNPLNPWTPIGTCESSQKGASTKSGGSKSPSRCVYELRHREAQVLVGRAVHGARAVVGSAALEVDNILEPVEREGSHWQSSLSSCSLDCVADCVNSHEETFRAGQFTKSTRVPRQFTFAKHADAGGSPEGRGFSGNTIQPPDCVNVPGTAQFDVTTSSPRTGIPKLMRQAVNVAKDMDAEETNIADEDSPCAKAPWSNRSAHSPRQYLSPRREAHLHGNGRCASFGCLGEEDEDNWLNFHSSRSPLRWLAPVLDPVMRALSPSQSRSPSRTMPAPPTTGPSPRTTPTLSPSIHVPPASRLREVVGSHGATGSSPRATASNARPAASSPRSFTAASSHSGIQSGTQNSPPWAASQHSSFIGAGLKSAANNAGGSDPLHNAVARSAVASSTLGQSSFRRGREELTSTSTNRSVRGHFSPPGARERGGTGRHTSDSTSPAPAAANRSNAVAGTSSRQTNVSPSPPPLPASRSGAVRLTPLSRGPRSTSPQNRHATGDAGDNVHDSEVDSAAMPLVPPVIALPAHASAGAIQASSLAAVSPSGRSLREGSPLRGSIAASVSVALPPTTTSTREVSPHSEGTRIAVPPASAIPATSSVALPPTRPSFSVSWQNDMLERGSTQDANMMEGAVVRPLSSSPTSPQYRQLKATNVLMSSRPENAPGVRVNRISA